MAKTCFPAQTEGASRSSGARIVRALDIRCAIRNTPYAIRPDFVFIRYEADGLSGRDTAVDEVHTFHVSPIRPGVRSAHTFYGQRGAVPLETSRMCMGRSGARLVPLRSPMAGRVRTRLHCRRLTSFAAFGRGRRGRVYIDVMDAHYMSAAPVSPSPGCSQFDTCAVDTYRPILPSRGILGPECSLPSDVMSR